ncbi:threonylcarbamoyl-AMP synthase isoform X2 [Ochotona princeps]|uniref:threonylcarbamoyl-AMP synthase isoform X2 n=1 Tax=Ochotona princeps TaxID=9978 RepID=UPI002714D127|nr:threonylcarbamoyl-AMP synthase isoform X2 [Ochotona princeps]
MCLARRGAELRATLAAVVGLSDGAAGSARGGRFLRPAAPEARLLRLPGGGGGAERAGWGSALRAAVAELRAGAVVAVPTDTLYGLACSASCSAALDAVYRLKGRSETKPLAVCLGRVADVYRYCHVQVPEQLLRDLLPGPVTLVMERTEELNRDLNPFTPEFQDLWPHLSLVIDGGQIGEGQSAECRLGSTVVDLSVPGKFGIIRPGCALESTTAILQQYGLLPAHGPCL